MLETVLSHIAPFVSILGAGGTAALAASSFGIGPRFGVVRALEIALRSRLRRIAVPPSIREDELKTLQSRILNKAWKQQYVVVTGQKGVGKSYLIQSAIDKTCGVIKVRALPGKTADELVHAVLKILTNIRLSFVELESCAKRIAWFHNLFIGRPPIIVLQVSDGSTTSPQLELTAVARALMEIGVNVIVDGSSNSISQQLLESERQSVLNVEPLSEDQIWMLPQLENISSVVSDDMVLKATIFKVMGGVPAPYAALCEELQTMARDHETDLHKLRSSQKELVEQFLFQRIQMAVDRVVHVENENIDFAHILSLLREQNFVLDSKALVGLQRSQPDKVLRAARKGKVKVIVPATSEVDLVLRHNFSTKTSWQDVLQALSQTGQGKQRGSCTLNKSQDLLQQACQ